MTDTLQAALEREDLKVAVEPRDALAILVPRQPDAIASDAARRKALALSAEHGFSHVALELT